MKEKFEKEELTVQSNNWTGGPMNQVSFPVLLGSDFLRALDYLCAARIFDRHLRLSDADAAEFVRCITREVSHPTPQGHLGFGYSVLLYLMMFGRAFGGNTSLSRMLSVRLDRWTPEQHESYRQHVRDLLEMQR
jgi:hypothetical protein